MVVDAAAAPAFGLMECRTTDFRAAESPDLGQTADGGDGRCFIQGSAEGSGEHFGGAT